MGEVQKNPDRQVVRQVLRGDVDAFSDLVARYQTDVFRCTMGVTGNREDAADAAQETFVRLYRHLDQYNPQRPLRPYLMTIAVNTAKSIVRKRRHDPFRDDGQDALVSLPDRSPAPETALRRRERVGAIRRGLAQLPTMLRDSCVLVYLDGFSCRETAQILNTSEGAVKTALHRARRQLARSPLREWLTL